MNSDSYDELKIAGIQGCCAPCRQEKGAESEESDVEQGPVSMVDTGNVQYKISTGGVACIYAWHVVALSLDYACECMCID